MSRILLIGDVHSSPDELPDCEKLLDLVETVLEAEDFNSVVFMGDLYNTHDIVNVRCIEFWNRRFKSLSSKVWLGNQDKAIYALVGNHDQVTPTKSFPHSLIAHQDLIQVVDEPQTHQGFAMIPYTHSPQEFVGAAKVLRGHTLLCHQTFQGATYENGFFAKDAIQTSDVSQFKQIYSGHIHTPQQVSQVQYIGAPRWRTRSDANIDRHLWVLESSEKSCVVVKKIPTDVCRRIHAFADMPDSPLQVVGYKPEDKLLVDVYGPDQKTVRARETEIKSKYPGAITRGFPDKTKTSEVSESEGISVAFKKFSATYRAPLGTPKVVLDGMMEDRLGQFQQ